MPNFFNNFLWNLLPPWYSRVDTYKDTSGKGLLERYLRGIGTEVDDNLVDFIINLLDILSPQLSPESLLVFLSSNLGYIPSFDQDTNTYRRILSAAPALYKLKGTVLSFEMLFEILGYTVEVVEELPLKPVIYDSGFIYDDPANRYDSECQWCSGFYLKIWPISNPETFEIPESVGIWLPKVCEFLRPINAIYGGFEAAHSKKIKYGWVKNLEDIITYPQIQNLQYETTIVNPNDDIECDFRANSQFRILAMAEPIETTNLKTNWYGSDLNRGNIDSIPKNPDEANLFGIHLFIPGYRVYFSNYLTKQTQTTLKFKV